MRGPRADARVIPQPTEHDDRDRQNIANYGAAAREVLSELAAIGYQIDAIGDLRRLGKKYPDAIPILARWLPRVADVYLKEDIVRTLSVPWAIDAASILLSEFERADDPGNTGIRWAIGNALEVVANDRMASELIRLATERRFGRAREMVVLGLGKLRDARVTDVLLHLLSDDDVVGHAVMALGKLRATAARPHLEPLLTHPRLLVRTEAKKALARIDAAR